MCSDGGILPGVQWICERINLMKAGFGLVGLLIAIGVLVWLWSSVTLPHNKATIDAGRKATEDINQLSGSSADGSMRFDDSLQIDVLRSGGKPASILVLEVKSGGPAEIYYGLKKDDCITELGPLHVRDQISGNDDARDFLMDAYQRKHPLVVIRREQKVTLPIPKPTAQRNPAAPSSPQSQVDSIRKQVGGK